MPRLQSNKTWQNVHQLPYWLPMPCQSKVGRTLPYLYENAALSEFFLFRIFCPSLAVWSSLGSFLWISGKSKPFFILIMASLASLRACNDKYQSLVFCSVETWIPLEILRTGSVCFFQRQYYSPKQWWKQKTFRVLVVSFRGFYFDALNDVKMGLSFQRLPINPK